MYDPGMPDVQTVATEIRSLQRGWSSHRDERRIVELVRGMRGPALTALKSAIDGGDDRHDLMKLVFGDIDDADMRRQILDHLAEEAGPRRLKILSDVDDTLYLNWVDRRYPKKTVYPGVVALYGALDRGPGDPPDPTGDLVFVTARPDDRLGWMERQTFENLRGAGLTNVTVLCGDFAHLVGNERIAQGKHRNFVRYSQLYPEADFVFFGDSGQGDVSFGRRMRASHPERVRGVFIHDVVATPAAERARLAAEGIDLHDTYPGAAARALALGLVSRAAGRAVAEAARAELARITFDEAEQRAARVEELERDAGGLWG